MGSTERILIGVARADLIVCSVLKWLGVIFALSLVLILILILVWAHRPDPHLIDYDAPGVDITSEGPYDDSPWYDFEDEDHIDHQ